MLLHHQPQLNLMIQAWHAMTASIPASCWTCLTPGSTKMCYNVHCRQYYSFWVKGAMKTGEQAEACGLHEHVHARKYGADHKCACTWDTHIVSSVSDHECACELKHGFACMRQECMTFHMSLMWCEMLCASVRPWAYMCAALCSDLWFCENAHERLRASKGHLSVKHTGRIVCFWPG